MTVIVELRQPDDGAHCRRSRRRGRLTQLDGAALQSALQAIYTPLLTPANLKQVRTNEFLVGPQIRPSRHRRGSCASSTSARMRGCISRSCRCRSIRRRSRRRRTFDVGAGQQRRARTRRRDVPVAVSGADGSEDGTRGHLGDPVLSTGEHSTCAGCHTTATNSAFAHVAERYQGTGRAEISQFLRGRDVEARAATSASSPPVRPTPSSTSGP